MISNINDEAAAIIETCDSECEGANYHDRCGMAPDLFAAIKGMVPARNLVNLAQAVSDVITP